MTEPLDDATIARLADALAVRMRLRVTGKGQPWRTVEDVAEELRCKPATIRAYIASGDLRAYDIGGRWIVPPDEFDAFTAARRVHASDPASTRDAPTRLRAPKRGLRARLDEDHAPS
jgi:excisionase family DNA binding protein